MTAPQRAGPCTGILRGMWVKEEAIKPCAPRRVRWGARFEIEQGVTCSLQAKTASSSNKFEGFGGAISPDTLEQKCPLSTRRKPLLRSSGPRFP